jgi:hypothetical protein
MLYKTLDLTYQRCVLPSRSFHAMQFHVIFEWGCPSKVTKSVFLQASESQDYGIAAVPVQKRVVGRFKQFVRSEYGWLSIVV